MNLLKIKVMKILKLLSVILIAASLTTYAQKKDVNIEKSMVKWTGKKVGGLHYGEIQLKSGNFEFKDNNIVGGEVVMDMNSITDADLEDPGYNEKLVGHLKSDDFFGVEKYPVSSFVVTKATPFNNDKATITGEITIKGKTEKISFNVVKKGNVYISQLKIDRSKFDVRYGSNSFFDNLGDKAIEDIFVLDIKLTI